MPEQNNKAKKPRGGKNTRRKKESPENKEFHASLMPGKSSNSSDASSSSFKRLTQKFLTWCKQHIAIIKGLVLLIAGITLIIMTRRVMLNLTVFVAGLCLAYYGLRTLHITQVTNIIDRLIGKIKR